VVQRTVSPEIRAETQALEMLAGGFAAKGNGFIDEGAASEDHGEAATRRESNDPACQSAPIEADPSSEDRTGRPPLDDLTPRELLPQVYEELRSLAERSLRAERVGHTLQPTALVHEAWLRLADLDLIEWTDKAHFVRAAAGTIRRILVDHARGRGRERRGGGARRVTLSAMDPSSVDNGTGLDVLALDDALGQLRERGERKARVVELRYFGGLTIQETADALEVGTTTVEDDWAFARAWLRRALGNPSGGS